MDRSSERASDEGRSGENRCRGVGDESIDDVGSNNDNDDGGGGDGDDGDDPRNEMLFDTRRLQLQVTVVVKIS